MRGTFILATLVVIGLVASQSANAADLDYETAIAKQAELADSLTLTINRKKLKVVDGDVKAQDGFTIVLRPIKKKT